MRLVPACKQTEQLCYVVVAVVLVFALGSCSQEPVTSFEGRNGKYTHSYFYSPSRGKVDYVVYLPPDWKSDDDQSSYPLIIFLHGHGDSENLFRESVDAEELNEWIANDHIPPFVLLAIGAEKDNFQWTHTANEVLISSDAPGELLGICRTKFRAGLNGAPVSIEGFSRGARGALHFALKYPDKFASAISNAFVSNYALKKEMVIAKENAQNYLDSKIRYRMSIGDQDEWVLEKSRDATAEMHAFLNSMGMDHDYEVLPGVSHNFKEIWNAINRDNVKNGLYQLKMHASAWKMKETIKARPAVR